MAVDPDRYIPKFEPKKEKDPAVGISPLTEEFRKVWESIHQLHGKLDTIKLLNNLNVDGSIESTGEIVSDDSVTLNNFLQANQREFNAQGILTPDVAPSGSGRVYFDKITQQFLASENLGAYVPFIPPSPLGTDYQSLISLSGDLAWNTNPYCIVTRTADQTGILASTETPINFTAEIEDNLAMHDNVTDNSHITIKRAGMYSLFGQAIWDVNATGTFRTTYLKQNGTTYLSLVNVPPFAGQVETYVATKRRFAVNDYIELYVIHDASSNRTITYGTPYSPIFGAMWLCP